MYQEEFNKIVSDHAQLSEIDMVDIRSMSERYPYCQVAHVIYAKKLRELNNNQFENQLKKASLSVYDRNILYRFIEKTPLKKIQVSTHEIEEKNYEPLVEFKEPLQEPTIEEVPIVIEIPKEEPQLHEPIAEKESVEESIIEEIPIEQEIPVDEPQREEPTEEKEPELMEQELEEVQFNVSDDETKVEKDELSEQKEEKLIPLDEELQPVIENEPVEEVDETIMQDTELIMQDLMESMPELKIEQEHISEQNENEEVKQEEAVQIEHFVLDETEQDLEPELVEEEDQENIFELPPYDIESELGPLPEQDKIKITIQRPVFEEEKVEEVYEDSFVGWLNRLGSPSKGIVVEQKEKNRPVQLYLKKENPTVTSSEKKTTEAVFNEGVAAELAKKSVQANEHLVTETYARILVMQGKYPKAVEMYSKLILLKPQKSDYFAALIDQLKKRIK